MESVYSQYAWLIPLFPLLAFAVILTLGRQAKGFASWLGILGAAASFILSVLVMVERLDPDAQDYIWNDFTWLQVGDLAVTMGFEVNNLNALMLLVVSFVSLLVNIYSRGYMADDERMSIYYGYVALFTFSMLGLVLSENLLQLYIFWELVGVCSFLLIGFWYFKPEAKAAAKKAFIVTRIGDLGLLIGILLLFWETPGHSFSFSQIANAVHQGHLSGGVLTAVAILIFIGAVGKSGQFPLHTWLPDAMEGPTPISALIHAATMVAAGVYLVARTFVLFEASDAALTVVAYTGAFTAIFAAAIAIAQNDIKRVLAYSTISQLGYMMMAMGIGTAMSYSAGIFHLFTHAFFKALLFLAAGSVIHALHEQNILKMGGVGRKMKITMWTFAFGMLALSGIVPFSGFWSKDAILSEALAHDPVLFAVGIVTAFLTAFYMARLFFLVFTGEPRDQGAAKHAHESPAVMTVPLVILAVPTLIAGFVSLPNRPWLADWLMGREMEGHVDLVVLIASTVVGIAGLLLGWALYGRRGAVRDDAAAASSAWYRILQNKFYIDELYRNVFVKPYRGLGSALNWFDRSVVDGAVRLVAGASIGLGRLGTRLQNGQVQTYGLISLLGLAVLVVAVVGRRFLNVD
jgi:NADH-quinone oxidoreductase subunit L